MIGKIVMSCFIVLATSQLSALERAGQQHVLKFVEGKIIVVDNENSKIPVKVISIKTGIDNSTLKLQEVIFDIQHTNKSVYTCTMKDKPLASAIKFNTTTSCTSNL